MVAAAIALFVKIQQHTDDVIPAGWTLDVPSLFLLAIVLTAVALGSWKEHSAVQIMLQVTLACVSCLTLIWIGEAQYDRAIRYWYQGTFAATVTLPMLARRYVKTGLPRGPRRNWWKKTCEAIFFSFLTMLLVTAGGALEAYIYMAASGLSAASTPANPPKATTPPVPIYPDPALQTPPPTDPPSNLSPLPDLPPVKDPAAFNNESQSCRGGIGSRHSARSSPCRNEGRLWATGAFSMMLTAASFGPGR
jgi:hypothetical protein